MDFYRVLGLMSGTSLDGLDVAQCIFEYKQGRWSYVIERATTFQYSTVWKDRLASAWSLSGLELTMLHHEFGSLMAAHVNQFLEGQDKIIDLIASHGHTVFHEPLQKSVTLQIGHGACIAAQTGITTVCDFRSLDVALGGQGAPLVPIGDQQLFGEFDYCLNLGGFANISYNDPSDKRLAFDICPVNIVINHLVKERNLHFDPEGSIASQGVLNQELLTELNNLNFYHQNCPKSLGKEWVIKEMMPVLNRYPLLLEDKLRTFYEHVVIQISKSLVAKENNTLLITGGGTHNNFLLSLLKNFTKVKIHIPDNDVIDFKEAMIFAFLGVLRMRNEVNCLSSVTGASKDNCGGVVYWV